jgi:Cdc6-like AAA superfamily ATPase
MKRLQGFIRNAFPGTEDEVKIVKSGVREVFTPYAPISSVELFFGRQEEVQRVIASINTPGQHVVLYGERGVGKSSLAAIITMIQKHVHDDRVVFIRCDTSSTFKSIIRAILVDLGIGYQQVSTTVSKKETAGAEGNVVVAKGSVSTSNEKTTTSSSELPNLTPSHASRLIGESKALIIIDEFDTIVDPTDRQQFAEVIKHLSDSHSETKLMIVGIARSCKDLMAGHASVQRDQGSSREELGKSEHQIHY